MNWIKVVWEYVPRIPNRLRVHYRDVIWGIVCSICIALTNILRESESSAPFLSIHITSYIFCFCLSLLLLKCHFKFKEIKEKEWKALSDMSCMGRIIIAGALMAVHLTFKILSRKMVSSAKDTWSLDIWDSHIPFWVAVFGKTFSVETATYSLGTSLATTCGLVLMVPLNTISVSALAHTFSLIKVISLAGFITIIHQIVNQYATSKEMEVSHYHIMIHISTVIPLLLIFVVGFVETPSILTFMLLPPTKMAWICLSHGIMTFLSTMSLIFLLQDKPLFLGTIVFSLGNCIAILSSAEPIALFGGTLVVMTLFIHLFLIYTDSPQFTKGQMETHVEEE